MKQDILTMKLTKVENCSLIMEVTLCFQGNVKLGGACSEKYCHKQHSKGYFVSNI